MPYRCARGCFAALRRIRTIQYRAFGKIRASSGITPTEFRYTGQLRQAELGLYYYVARWYDPALAHFTQADTIVPNAGDSAAWNRYSYVVYNSIINIDPSGHRPINGDPLERAYTPKPKSLVIFTSDYGQKWTNDEMEVLNNSARAIARALARETNNENRMLWKSGDIDRYSSIKPATAFYKAFGGPIIACRSSEKEASWAQHMGKLDGVHSEIWFYKTTSVNVIIDHPYLFTHEIGHAFDAVRNIDANSIVPVGLLRPINNGVISGTNYNDNTYYGYYGPHYQYQFGRDLQNRAGEELADMFVGWVYNKWGESTLGNLKKELISNIIGNYYQ